MKKYMAIIICLLAFTRTCFAVTPFLEVGIGGQASSMKPAPITIEKSMTFELNDILVIKGGASPVHIHLTDALLNKSTWPLEREIFINSSQASLSYSHYRDGQVIDEKAIDLILNDQLALGILSDLDHALIEVPNIKSYILTGHDLTDSRLNMFDYIYINSFYTETMSDTSVEALLAWIAKGGILFVQSDVGSDQTYTGFLTSLKDKNTMSYGFGEIQNTKTINTSLQTAKSKRLYPSVSLNNYRGLNKRLLKLNQKNTWTIYFITLGTSLIGLVFLWLPLKKTQLKYGGYIGLVIFSFLLLSVAYTKPLKSLTAIEWHNGLSTKMITCLHSLEGDKVILPPEISGQSIKLYDSHSEDEQSLISFYEKADGSESDYIGTELQLKDNHLSGHMIWQDKEPIDKAVLLLGNTLIPIGKIKENQKIHIDYQINTSEADISDYQRQISLVKDGHWHMDESLIFNEFQQWYQQSQDFQVAQPLLLGFKTTTIGDFESQILLVEPLSLEGGERNE